MTRFLLLASAASLAPLLIANSNAQGVKPDHTSRMAQWDVDGTVNRDAGAATIRLRRAWLASHRSLPQQSASPQITAGKIITTKLNVADQPAAPVVSVSFATGPSLLCQLDVFFQSASGTQTLDVGYFALSPPLLSAQGTLKVQDVGGSYRYGAFNTYSASGKWSLVGADIYDCAGNSTYYNQSAVAQLFPKLTIQVTNKQKPDITPPTLTAGKVLTPKVSLSSDKPYFAVKLSVTDDSSGAQYVQMTVCPPAASGLLCTSTAASGSPGELPAPVAHGDISSNIYLGVYSFYGSQAVGQWTISNLRVCDVVQNCVSVGDSSGIQNLLGTTTFKVTQ